MTTRRFAGFLVAGGIAALANFGSRIAISLWLPYVPAIVLAYGVGMLTAFVLNRAFVFTDAATGLRHQVLWFAAVNLLAVAQTVAISVVLARWGLPALGVHDHAETIAHA